MKTPCNSNFCTACQACAIKCPKHCISFEPDSMGSLQPSIDETLCVDCGACQNVCPNINRVKFRDIKAVYAAWNVDKQHRSAAASGGVAAALYKNILRNQGFGYGVTFSIDKGAYYVEISEECDIPKVQNSKYVYSSTESIYDRIKRNLQLGKDVLFVGLPCQVAGLINYLGKDYENLVTVDIVCHGVAPFEQLRKHIQAVEQKKKRKAKKLYFRDPSYSTSKFIFSLYDGFSSIPFYKKQVHANDAYQIAYHYALNYRENCYKCLYARKERISDITISDFTGLGTDAPIDYEKKNVSAIKVSTEKGANYLRQCSDLLVFDERPLSEAFYDKQMVKPSIKNKARESFLMFYEQTGDFDLSVSRSMWKTILKNQLYICFRVEKLKVVLAALLPSPLKMIAKKIVKG